MAAVFQAELSGRDIDLALTCPRVPSGDLTADDLPELEESYRIYDLTYYYLDRALTIFIFHSYLFLILLNFVSPTSFKFF